MEDHKKLPSIQILIEVEVKVVKLHLEVNTEVRMMDIMNVKFSFMEVDKELYITLLEILSYATSQYATGMQLVVVCNYLGHVCN